jgi:translation initiation factor 2B subunit (eIF-2B alpha/beta/delta family)
MSDYDWHMEVEQFAKDTLSGSQAICLKASEIVAKAVDSIPKSMDSQQAGGYIRELAKGIENAKPAMAGLYTLAAGLIEALENVGGDGIRAAETARHYAVGYRGRLLTSNDKIASNTRHLLPQRACIATYSHSGTVNAVLRHAKQHGKIRRVLVSEGRPAFEGRLTAEEAVEANITVTFASDAALPGLLDQCDLVIVGGDALCPAGLVNKAGTLPLALAANRIGKPFVVCIGSEKLIPFDIPEHCLKEAPEALWETSKISIQVVNRIFEFTPLELIDHVVTEDIVTSGGEIPYLFAKMKINPYLANR